MSSVWEIDSLPKHEALKRDLEVDVCIIGGGITGAWCAYLISKAGKRVVVLESGKLGRGATLYTTGFITESIDTPFEELEKMFDHETSELVRQSGAEAIDLIEALVEERKIDCEFKRLPLEIRKDFKSIGKSEGTRFERQAKFHPMKFFKGLLEAAEESGAKFYEHTGAKDIKKDPDGIEVSTISEHIVRAKDVVVASYEPFNNPKPTHFKKGMYVSFVLALELAKGALAEGMYVDTKNPYHYARIDEMDESLRMVIGGEDHRAEIKFESRQSFKALEEYLQDSFPGLKYKITHKWQGGILESSDGLALIGEYASQEYVATAFSGNGMTYSAIAGRLLADLILEKRSKYERIYDPKRHLKLGAVIRKARDYTEEFFGGAVKNLFK